ncbi:MAG TPA: hypothetical protein VGK15_04220 [Candidatus Limnocylindria bacterium]
MRRILTAITATALALSLVAQATPAQAAVPGYFSSFFGESAFLNLQQGSTGQFVAIFTNTGGTGWLRNSASQVNLGVCLSDKTTCNVTSPNSTWNDGSWLSNIAYATHSTDFVGPGQNGFFVYNVKAPLTATAGATYTFNGDLVLGSTLQQLAPQGYYQSATVQAAAGPSTNTTCTGAVGGATSCVGTATAPTGATITGISEKWSDAGAGTTGTLSCAADDGAFDETVETYTCTTATLGSVGPVVKITTTSTASNATTGTETDYIGDSSGPVTTGALGTQGTSEFNHYTGSTTDALTPIANAQYRVLNPDATTKIDWTSLPASDGAYNELTETINFRVDTTGFANGTYIVEVRGVDSAGNTGSADIENMIVTSGADTTVPACSATAAQSGLKVKTTGTATDDTMVSNVEVKIQKLDGGIWSDVSGYVAATANDGAFNETSEGYTQTSTDQTFANTTSIRTIARTTDSSGNQATCTSNTVVWNSAGVGSDVTAPTVTVTSASLTPTSGSSTTFTGVATDDTGVTSVTYAVSRNGTGATVTGWTACTPNDGTFSETIESFTCVVTWPTETTAQAGNSFNVLVRGADAASNVGTPADATSGAFGADETCSFFTQQSSGVTATGNCVFARDNKAPFISTAVKTTDGGSVGTVSTGDTITLTFPEEMRSASTSTPQSITLTDGTNTVILTNGVNATFTRTLNAGTSTWTIVPTVNTAVAYPATITALNNFRDWAGNFAANTGDNVVD